MLKLAGTQQKLPIAWWRRKFSESKRKPMLAQKKRNRCWRSLRRSDAPLLSRHSQGKPRKGALEKRSQCFTDLKSRSDLGLRLQLWSEWKRKLVCSTCDNTRKEKERSHSAQKKKGVCLGMTEELPQNTPPRPTGRNTYLRIEFRMPLQLQLKYRKISPKLRRLGLGRLRQPLATWGMG